MTDAGDGVTLKLVAALDRLARGQRMFRQEVADRHALTPLQAHIVAILATAPPPDPNPSALARELDVRQPTVSDAVGILQAKRLVVRRPDPSDRRRIGLQLTPAGRTVAADLAIADGVLADALSAIPPAAQAETLRVLLDVIAALHRAGVITVARTCTTCRFHDRTESGSHCRLLDIPLAAADLRVNCPEHEPAVTSGG